MDPELTNEVEEQLRQLSEMVSQQTAAMAGMSKAITDTSTSLNTISTNSRKLSDSQTNNNQSTNQNTTALTALQRANKEASEKLDEFSANMERALTSSGTALRSLAKAAFSSEEGFTKYNDAIGGVGEAAWNVGKNFGILGMVIGGLFKAGSMVLQYQTKQADALLGATDSFSRMGAAGTLTAEQVRKMGAGAGLTSLELDKLVKPMQSVRGGFVALGGTQSEGIKKFGEMAAVSEDVRREFKRLGMGDQERNQSLADFVSLMNESGRAIDGPLKTQAGLQKAALEYTRNMYELAEITGQDVETAKKKNEAAMATMEVALMENKWRQETLSAEKRLKEATTDAERAAAQADIDRVGQERKRFENFTKQLQQANLSSEQIAAAQNQYLTGAVTDTSAQFALWGVDLNDLIRKSKEGTLEDGAAAEEIKNKYNKTLSNVGHDVVALAGSEFQRTMGINEELTKRSTQQMGTDYRQVARIANEAVNANRDGTGAAAQDPAQEARNDLTETLRKRRLQIDAYAAAYNPLLGNMGMLKGLAIAAGAAAAVLALLVAGKAAKAGVGVVKRGLSTVGGLFKRGSGAAAGGAGGGEVGAVKSIEQQAMGGLAKAAGGGAASPLGQVSKAADAPGASKVGIFLEGLATGFRALGKAGSSIVTGAGYMSAAIVVIGAAVAAATWMMGKALPNLATGLKAFDKLNGPNLKQVGIGMAGLGAGILAMGAGKVAGAIGNVVNWFVKGEDPLENAAKQIKKLEAITLDTPKIKANSEALAAFSKAMVAASMMGAGGAVANAGKGIADAINGYFGGKPATEQLVEFSKLEIDSKNVRKNARAFTIFANAMASYKGYGSNSGAAGQAISEAITGFFKSTPPYQQMVEFGELNVNTKKVSINAIAFKRFASAMASFKGYGSNIGAVGEAIAQASSKFFEVSPPFDQVVYFSRLKIDPVKTQINATAFKLFSEAMATYKGMGVINALGAISTAMADAAYRFFAVKPPLEQFVYFSYLKIDPKQTDINSKAFVSFANAMAQYRGGPGLVDVVSSLVGKGFGALFGEDGPIDAFRKFSSEDFGPNMQANSDALAKYAQSAASLARTGSSGAYGGGGDSGGNPPSGDTSGSASQPGGSAPSPSGAPGAPGSTQYTASTTVDPKLAQGGGYLHPVPGGSLTSSYGMRMHPIKKRMAFHTGLDIGKGEGATLLSPKSGVVTKLTHNKPPYTGFGDAVIIKHDDGYQSVMAHTSAQAVREGQTVQRGQEIAKMGHTGMSTGPHLHYIIQKAGFAVPNASNTIDPGSVLKPPQKASWGGIFAESDPAFPGELAGKKLAPLQADSIIMKLAKTAATATPGKPKEKVTSTGSSTASRGGGADQAMMNMELYGMVSKKIDKMISILENSHDTHTMMLSHAKT